ncbi:MAG: tetratricopeptide repeat protein [Bacteroidaceae bacterium]|nr:tetratricopeptide repeat protein [Bacteroidaceae bacterium]
MLCAAVLLGACGGSRVPQQVASQGPATHVPQGRTPLFQYLYLEANREKLAGNYAEAYDLLRHCQVLQPDAPELLSDLGLFELMLHNDSVGVGLLKKASATDAQNPYYKETLASYYLERHDVAQALPALEDLAAMQPQRVELQMQLVQLYNSTNRFEDAIRALDRIETLEGKSAHTAYQKFALYKQLNNEQKAFAELEALCREYPHEMSYRLAVGNQLLLAGRHEEALRVFDEVRQKEPGHKSLPLSMLEYYRQVGRDSLFASMRDSLMYAPGTDTDVRAQLVRDYVDEQVQADSAGKARLEQAFGRLLAHFPEDINLLQLRAAYLATYEPDNEPLFVDAMERVIRVEPDNVQAISYLIQHYGTHKDFVRLEDLCRRAVIAHPEELVFHYYLGVACWQMEKRDDALKAFQDGVLQKDDDSRPAMVADLFSQMGDVLYEMGRKQQAYAAYDSCLAYQADNVGCLNNYAYYLSLENENLDKAEEMSYRTIRLEPNNKTYLDTYAWILFQKERYAEAQAYMNRVVPPASTDSALLADDDLSAVVLEHAGDVAACNGQLEQAMRFWQLAQRMGGTGLTTALPRKIKQKKYLRK